MAFLINIDSLTGYSKKSGAVSFHKFPLDVICPFYVRVGAVMTGDCELAETDHPTVGRRKTASVDSPLDPQSCAPPNRASYGILLEKEASSHALCDRRHPRRI